MDDLKIIFLDVDGVLNSNLTQRRTTDGFIFVSGRHIKNLKRIIDATGAKVVLSSSWRMGRDDPSRNGDFLELRDELQRYGISFYGFTSELRSCDRGAEISQWLEEHPDVTDYAVIDDSTQISPHEDRWVRTSISLGLREEDVPKAIAILTRGEMPENEL